MFIQELLDMDIKHSNKSIILYSTFPMDTDMDILPWLLINHLVWANSVCLTKALREVSLLACGLSCCKQSQKSEYKSLIFNNFCVVGRLNH